jgi:hypothetical protein
MTRIEEMTTVSGGVTQAMRLLRETRRISDWMSPDLSFVPISVTASLNPGDRFRVSPIVGPSFEYLVEAVSDRELIMSFWGPWCGRERWSFIADAAETVVRRVYEVTDAGSLPAIIVDTVIRAVVSTHYKLELSRFRALVEHHPGPRAEIPSGEPPSPPSRIGAEGGDAKPSPDFPVDDG